MIIQQPEAQNLNNLKKSIENLNSNWKIDEQRNRRNLKYVQGKKSMMELFKRKETELLMR